MTMAQTIMSKAPFAVRHILDAVNRGMEASLQNGCGIETDLLVKCYATEDWAEGISSFLERRKPQYKGK